MPPRFTPYYVLSARVCHVFYCRSRMWPATLVAPQAAAPARSLPPSLQAAPPPAPTSSLRRMHRPPLASRQAGDLTSASLLVAHCAVCRALVVPVAHPRFMLAVFPTLSLPSVLFMLLLRVMI